MDAVSQLIQLSGGSDDDLRVLWVDFAVDGRISAADASSISSSSSMNQEKMLDDEPLPRSNHRFGSLVDIYGKTASPNLIRNRSKKRARF